MPFHISKIEFRWDTLISTLVLAGAFLGGTVILRNRLAVNDAENKLLIGEMVVATKQLSGAVASESGMQRKLDDILGQHVALMKEEEVNSVEILKLETELKKKK
jgi:hypothetical protein